jgi:hypothetical protein
MSLGKFCNVCGTRRKDEDFCGDICSPCIKKHKYVVGETRYCTKCGEKVISPRRIYCSNKCGGITYTIKHVNLIRYECRCQNDNKHDHHFDYSRPTEVLRLCPSCHRTEHKRLKKLANHPEGQPSQIPAAGRYSIL